MSFKNFNWNNIRPINGDVKIGFEELCCQLAYYEKMPIGSIYTRKGTPDGGVECFWKLSDNSEICYQAKFFINSPTNSEWCQIKKSLYEAVNNHQNLTQYIVCLPLNFSDGSKTKTKNQKTALDKWNEYIKKWEADIKIKFKKKIRISYWGETEIIDRLSKPEHRGRYYFWFNKDLFTNEWFNNFFNETKANVGARYSPEINITLPINKVFDTLLRNDTLFFEIRKLRAELLKQKQELNFKDKLIKSKEELLCLHKKTDALIDYLNEYISGKFVYIDITKIVSLISDIITQSNKLNEIINQTKNEYKEKNDYEYKLHSINKFRRKLYEIENFFKQNHINLINQPFLLICGDAGQGKTHLFCEIISRQILSGKPALLFLGMNFKNNDPWKQMLDRIGLNCSREEFLGALNALDQLSNQRCLILIDALNESEERHFWKTYI
ncbi:hypothetical protein KA977_05080, partial [Candidatus Dependentiae bacterium]|nr:hypothetical protein [Candidatus Dependentiae bacterium]